MEYIIGATAGGFVIGLAVWSWCTSPILNGEEYVSFRASTCGRDDPRPSVFSRCWNALFGRSTNA